MKNLNLLLYTLLLSLILFTACTQPKLPARKTFFVLSPETLEAPPDEPKFLQIEAASDITIGNWFEFWDEVVAHFDTVLSYPITEHLLVRSNPWLIDSLAASDYYRRMENGIFTYDPQAVQIIPKGKKLLIPDSLQVESLMEMQGLVLLDVNIPEFKLRIWHYDSLLYTFPVRVGQNTERYLAMVNRNVDLRTYTGNGCIVRINKNPIFVNPRDNKRYEVTRRDDEKVTLLPRIPWIEPELDGMRYGHLIHPTTNPKTLGKAYSNGCVGVREGDMWIIYYYAPLGTSVSIRYEREIVGPDGGRILLEDIYPDFESEMKKRWKKENQCVCSMIE